MNKQRKQKLYARSLAYSSANHERGADSFSFEDGYRAAMRDMRKAIREALLHPHVSSSVRKCIAIEQFLRPLR
jgi:hypothetical protein